MNRILSFTRLKALSLSLVAVLLFSACDKMPPLPDKEDPKTIFETIATDKRFQLLTAAVAKAGLIQTLNDKKANLTLFAPTDDAFKAAGFRTAGDLAKVPEDALKALLLYHVLGTEVKSSQVPQAANTEVNTVANKPIFVTRNSSNRVFVNGVSVIQKDLDCTNGVIHVLNRVLLPATGTIVQTAIGNPNLSYLVAAVLRASQGAVNVAEVLSSAGPFTVFAPTNNAFMQAGFPTIASLQAADPAVLTPILTYHVIPARVFSSDLVNNSTPGTVNGGTVTITLTGGAKVKGNNNTVPSNIIATDILATNGVVHVIDRVLLP
jgi:uncharacterized surface protein with fasciclin (FAS1) repeats